MITLLVVDETSFIGALLSIAYAEEYTIIEAGNGSEAIEKIEKYSPEVVITSLHIPNISGVALISKIRSISNEIIIIVFDDFISFSEQSAIKAGANITISNMTGFNGIDAVVKRFCKKCSKACST